MRKFPRLGRWFVAALLTLGLYPVFYLLPPLVACTDHAAQSLVLALCGGVGGYLLLGERSPWLLAGAVTMILLTVWLGVYPLSPLFKNTLQGFTVITRIHGSQRIAPGDVLTMAAGAPAGLEPLTVLAPLHCHWISAQGGVFDDPQSCGTAYMPPARAYDTLKVIIQPGCGLPNTLGQIKISILP